MRPSDQLAAFTGDALRAGKSRSEIETAMRDAGWSEDEIRSALHAWADTGFTPPVPRPRAAPSPREAVLYGTLFIALVVSAFSLIQLGFELADEVLPDPFDRYSGSFGNIRWAMASLIVFFPLFLFLNTKVRRMSRKDRGSTRSPVRRWFAALTTFTAALVLLFDLLYVVYGLLNGELALRFLAKTVLVAIVAGAILFYYREEMQDEHDAQ